MELHLIRHGKTEANEKRLYCGSTDIILSDRGILELSDLKRQGIYPSEADLYFTSGLLRTEQTLDMLYGPVQREALPQLEEYHFGKFEMKSYDELKDRNDYNLWISDEQGLVTCPGGECRNGFNGRIIKGYELLMESVRRGNVSIAICHGGVIACVMEHLFPGLRNFYEWQPAPGRGYTIFHGSDGFKEI